MNSNAISSSYDDNLEKDSSNNDLADFRTVPFNIEAEQALLGAILVNNSSFDHISSFIEAKHFYNAAHQKTFQTISTLLSHGKNVTPITLKSYLENDGSLNDVGGVAYLAELAGSAISIINIADYGRVVYELAVRRGLISIGESLVNEAFDSDVDNPPEMLIENTEQSLYELAEKGKYGLDFNNFSQALTKAIEMTANAFKRDGHLSGISCGLLDIDKKMGGLQQSDLIILAGRPSMGKTALVTNIAFHVASAYKEATDESGHVEVVDGAVVGFFSLEMSAEQLATRIIAEQASIPSERIRRGQIVDHEFDNIVETTEKLQNIPLYIDETGGINITQLSARARKLKRQHGLGLIIVDYLQLLTGSSNKRQDNRVQELTDITTRLKALAKELNVPIIALSQLSRQVEQREDKRPQLSDLRESGSIEQDADVVMFVYREEYYIERSEPKLGSVEHEQWMLKMEEAHGIAEVIIGKQRHGPTGKIPLQFQSDVTRFSDLAQDDKVPKRID